MVFKKPTRLEYMRYLDQTRWYGKLGLTPWRWRAYLEPPQVPAKVKDWALGKMQAIRANRPKLMPQPVRVPIPIRGRRKLKQARIRPNRRRLKP
ncbi:MAG: hypothetical protein Q7S92_04045 [Candidatus Diapherotrites archaeon]|nr:hypothetical protein [Candidatus Diapherotrites archaeon]